MILTGKEIKKQVELGTIKIDPFDEKSCGPNSYDLRIGEEYGMVVNNSDYSGCIFLSNESKLEIKLITPDKYLILESRKAYLAHTIEVIESDKYVPIIHGRSSAARHGLMVHYAGLGDIGWYGQVVLELVNMTDEIMFLPVGVRVAQVSWHSVEGEIELYNSTYQNQMGIVPGKALT